MQRQSSLLVRLLGKHRAVAKTATGFPTSGTMIFNSDDQNTTAIIVNGNYSALTRNLTIQDGPSGQPTPIVGAVTLSGAISGSGGLIKTYPGTLILGSANTYTQGTTVSAGTLDAHVAGSLSTRDVNVASGAVLQLDTMPIRTNDKSQARPNL